MTETVVWLLTRSGGLSNSDNESWERLSGSHILEKDGAVAVQIASEREVVQTGPAGHIICATRSLALERKSLELNLRSV